MATYIQRDILTSDDGELDLSSGDIAVAGVRQSQRQLLINALSSTRGDYRFQPEFGWGGEGYIGRPNSSLTHQAMTDDIKVMLRTLEDMSSEDIDFVVAPIDRDVAGIVVRHSGIFIEPDGEILTDALVLGWSMSFVTGVIEPLE